jgi:hypothetical protein
VTENIANLMTKKEKKIELMAVQIKIDFKFENNNFNFKK